MHVACACVQSEQLRLLATDEVHGFSGDRTRRRQAPSVVGQLLHAAGAVEDDAAVACGNQDGLGTLWGCVIKVVLAIVGGRTACDLWQHALE